MRRGTILSHHVHIGFGWLQSYASLSVDSFSFSAHFNFHSCPSCVIQFSIFVVLNAFECLIFSLFVLIFFFSLSSSIFRCAIRYLRWPKHMSDTAAMASASAPGIRHQHQAKQQWGYNILWSWCAHVQKTCLEQFARCMLWVNNTNGIKHASKLKYI